VRLAVVALVRSQSGPPRAKPRPGSSLDLVCDFYVVRRWSLIFDSLGPLIRALNPHDKDAWLLAIDAASSASEPTVALARFATPFLSDVLTVCYALYYFHPIVLGALIYRDDGASGAQGRARAFRPVRFTMVAVFFASICRLLPRPRDRPALHDPPGAAPTRRGRSCDRRHPRQAREEQARLLPVRPHHGRDRGLDRGRSPLAPHLPRIPAFAIGLAVATVYGRYHYAIDVISGIALAFLVVPLARWFVTTGDATLTPAAPP